MIFGKAGLRNSRAHSGGLVQIAVTRTGKLDALNGFGLFSRFRRSTAIVL